MKLEGAAFVALVSVIIVTIAAIYADLFLGLLFQYNNIGFWFIAPIFAVVFALLVISYFRAVCSSPGHPNKTINQRFSEEQIARCVERAEAIKTKNKQRRKRRRLDEDPEEIRQLKETTFCQKCNIVKLPRVHHCKQCNACIERMDHHCPWVGNCVGRNNHKYFVLFLFYASFGLAIVWVSVAVDGLSNWAIISKATSSVVTALIGLAAGAALLLFLSIAVLCVTQVYMGVHNYTTLQGFIPGVDDKSPFDKKDWTYNMEEIFGKQYWMLPIDPKLPPYRDQWNINENSYKSPDIFGNTIQNHA